MVRVSASFVHGVMLNRYGTITDAIDLLTSHRVSSSSLVEAAIERIVSEDETTNALVCLNFKCAREEAAAADAMLAQGERRPLLGVPITAKESLRVKDIATCWGIATHSNWKPESESEVIKRLRAAGAVILGKTNVAFGLADWQTSNPVYGTTSNPYDLDRTSGGSSGGAAAALAAGFTFLDVGSDLLGSIRIPAHFCGIYGLRPSAGLVPREGHAFPGTLLSNEFAELGPMARSASDLSIALDVLAGPAMARPAQCDLQGLRVLLLDTHPLTRTSQAICHAVQTCGSAMSAAGAEVSVDAGDLVQLAEDTRIFLQLIAPYNAARLTDDEYAQSRDRAAGSHTDDSLAAFAWRACFAPARDWVRAREAAKGRQDAWKELFTYFDIVLCPVAPTVAFPHDHRPFYQRQLTIDGEKSPYFDQACWSTSASLCGLPAAVFPWTQEEGMPLGLQIIGPRGGDRTLLQVLNVLEGLSGGFRPPVS